MKHLQNVHFYLLIQFFAFNILVNYARIAKIRKKEFDIVSPFWKHLYFLPPDGSEGYRE